MNLGIIGVGKLGTALVKGMIRGGIDKKKIYVYDVSKIVLERVEVLGVNICRDVVELYMNSDVVVIAVKPQDVVDVLKSLPRSESNKKFVVSVAAFVPLKILEKYSEHFRVYRAMPNIAVEVNKSFTALAPIDRISSEIEDLFRIVGDVAWVKEEILDLLTIISSSTPAVVAELIDVFMLAALKAGVPYDIAKKAISFVFQGTGLLFEYKDVNSIRDTVITPRGVTISLIEKMYVYEVKNRLMKSLIDSIEEYLNRLKEYRKNME